MSVSQLRGADHLGSLLKIDQALDAAIEQQERRLKALRTKALQVQSDLFGGAPPVQAEMDFSATEARADVQELLEQFLSRHSSANDLGLRLHGEQLAAGVRFVRTLKEETYHLVIANPPYQGTSKMASTSYVESAYSDGKADLYAAFMLRGLELARVGGVSSMLTMRGWMFLKQYSELRGTLLTSFSLRQIHDLSSGAFEEISGVVVSVASSIIMHLPNASGPSIALKAFDDETVTRPGETARKRAASLCQERVYQFREDALRDVPEWPLVYWWGPQEIEPFKERSLVGEVSPAKFGLNLGSNIRFTRLRWEIGISSCVEARSTELFMKPGYQDKRWCRYLMGAAGSQWIDPVDNILKYAHAMLELKVSIEYRYKSVSRKITNTDLFFRPGIGFTMIGAGFAARAHWWRCIIDGKGSSLYPEEIASTICYLNSSRAKETISSLCGGLDFTVGDVNRLPLYHIACSDQVQGLLEKAFDCEQNRSEKSIEFAFPGGSPWRYAQNWAQQAVDRPEIASLPEYIEELDPEPPTDHLSFALGIALGRFAPVDEQSQPTTINPVGILDPDNNDLSHALPAGILFLDGSLEENDHRDDLGQDAAAPLHQAWSLYGSAIAPSRTLRDWLRLDFFKDVHKGMYENRPIHWPLSSSGKTFVAWVNIHRMDARTLKVLLADHLIPARSRIDGELDDLRQVRDSEERKAARAADTRIGKLTRWREELQEFIAAVEQCAEHGAPPTDGRCPEREQDAVYAPDLDDGVMINSAALWPLLEPQWKDPKKWWKELASAQGKKDYDWAHLAMRYWPTRVDEKCQKDPSLAVAHGCFWKYHPERAWAWELRLQQEIGQEFRIEEAPYFPGGRDIGEVGEAPHRQAWLSEHASEALAVVEKEATRRMGRGDNRQVVNEMRILEAGLWSVIPEKVAAMEQRLTDKQGQLFSLRAPDEAEGRAVVGKQSVQGGLFGASPPTDGGSPMMGREAENTPC